MGALDWLFYSLLILMAVVASCFAVAWFTARRSLRVALAEADDRRALLTLAKRAVEAKDHYVVEISDWGREYTGDDGTLPRYRWVVRDPFYHLKPLLGVEVMNKDWLMLGNASTVEDALLAAHQWIEHRQNPLLEMENR